MSGRKRGRRQGWEREKMERETGVGERNRDWTKKERERERERERETGMRERERERGYRCGIKRERETGNYFITFLATFLFSRCYKL